MLCGKFNKKEKEIITRCWNCNEYIYKGNLFYESSRSEDKGLSFRLGFKKGRSEKVKQCDGCYQNWRKKLKEKEKWWSFWKFLIVVAPIILLLFFLFFLFYPDKFEQISKSKDKFIEKFPRLGWVFLFSSFFSVVTLINEPEADKYEIREEKNNPKKKKKAWWRKIIFQK